jgi:hypothetical protein
MNKPVEAIIPEIMQHLLFNVHTSMPCQVISFDSAKQTVNVQPCLKRKFVGQDPINLPVIEDVPVQYPGSGDYWVTFDIKKDSYVLVVFSERSIEQWFLNGGIVDPLDNRRFHLSDAIAIPGINPLVDAVTFLPPVEADTIAIRKKDGTQYIKLNADGAEMLVAKLKVIGDLEVTGKADVTGNIASVTGNVDAAGTITAVGVIDGMCGTKKLSVHTHGFTTPSGPVLAPD